MSGEVVKTYKQAQVLAFAKLSTGDQEILKRGKQTEMDNFLREKLAKETNRIAEEMLGLDNQ